MPLLPLCHKKLFVVTIPGRQLNVGSSLPLEPRAPNQPALWRALLGLWLLGISFGYVEAAVVIYLRVLYEPVHRRVHPGHLPGDLFPLLTVAQLRAEQPHAIQWLGIELGREAATLILLAAVALASACNARTWLAALVLAFGVWDLAFYAWLRVLIGWPNSLETWDILFLLPVPWSGPVLSPIIVAMLMVGAGTMVLWRESRGRPVKLSTVGWIAVIVGGCVAVVAFCWDFRNTTSGKAPNPFNWPLFGLGLALALVGFIGGLRQRSPDHRP